LSPELAALSNKSYGSRYKKLWFLNAGIKGSRFAEQWLSTCGTVAQLRPEYSLCGCNIPEIIQGAHVWPVSSIKSANHVNYDDKLKYATDGDNGIWLCENHHKLFDRNMILVSEDGTVKYDTNIPVLYMPYLRDFTKNIMLPKIYLNTNFLNYLSIRNGKLDLSQYRTL
jgi:hypothetical protein